MFSTSLLSSIAACLWINAPMGISKRDPAIQKNTKTVRFGDDDLDLGRRVGERHDVFDADGGEAILLLQLPSDILF